VFGPCTATDRELRQLAEHGVHDRVLTAFAGSYTVVESTPHGTVVLTDPGHAQPIYTVSIAGGVLWGSSALALAALTGATPDREWLATTLLAPGRPALLTGRSAFTGVAAVSPGSRLVLAPGFSPQERRAWYPEPAALDLVEGATQVHTALSEAVRVRIASSRRPSADCSGGLDSTSLTLLAAEHLNNRRPVHAVTVHPAGTTHGGDLDYAIVATAGWQAIRHLLCPLESRHLPYSRMTELTPATDEPAPSTVAIARAVAEFDLLRQIDSDCHLTGDGGDTLFGAHPAYLADLAATAQVRLLMRHAIGWARLRRTSAWPLLADASLTAIRRAGDRTARVDHPKWASWSTPTARQLVVDALTTGTAPAKRQHLATSGTSGDVGTQTTVEAIQMVGRTARSDVQVAEHYGLRIHNPFTDAQVITACLTVSTWLRSSPFRYKPLLAEAMADLLPIPVATRQTKGDFTPDHYLGLRANTNVLHELASGRLAELGLVDPDSLRQLLDHAAAGLPVTFSEFEPVLAAETWLHTIDATHASTRWQCGAAARERTGP
jgi:asparagine synthase (glutamine-hydrolysing)